MPKTRAEFWRDYVRDRERIRLGSLGGMVKDIFGPDSGVVRKGGRVDLYISQGPGRPVQVREFGSCHAAAEWIVKEVFPVPGLRDVDAFFFERDRAELERQVRDAARALRDRFGCLVSGTFSADGVKLEFEGGQPCSKASQSETGKDNPVSGSFSSSRGRGMNFSIPPRSEKWLSII